MAAGGNWGVIITYRGVHSGQKAVRKMHKFVRDALKKAALHWWQKMLRPRFLPGATAKYNLTPGTARWNRFKVRLQGRRIGSWKGEPVLAFHVARQQPRPFVFSGQTQQMASERVAISGTFKKAKATIRVPWYFKIGRAGAKRVKQLMTVTQHEANELAKMVDADVGAALNADQTVERKTIAA